MLNFANTSNRYYGLKGLGPPYPVCKGLGKRFVERAAASLGLGEDSMKVSFDGSGKALGFLGFTV